MKDKLKLIWSRHAVTIVTVSSLIGVHYGWHQMQYNRSLVTEQEQIDLPVVTFAKYCWHQISGETDNPDKGKMILAPVSSTASSSK